ncbi:hypothetical protein PoB_005635400 [Plakobranchus ocellatus]|uniref:Uncharacterized protein n=1 Tax=Plakobranchus ocellatus TaxID=259542 RepID=A0AAV4CGC4_9GAST|nr:hypothetical protein PoB_005635400 [Plakobranchus ocellatus]
MKILIMRWTMKKFVAVRRLNVSPTVRQPLDSEELDEVQSDGNNGEEWREGTVTPKNLPFVSRTELHPKTTQSTIPSTKSDCGLKR